VNETAVGVQCWAREKTYFKKFGAYNSGANSTFVFTILDVGSAATIAG